MEIWGMSWDASVYAGLHHRHKTLHSISDINCFLQCLRATVCSAEAGEGSEVMVDLMNE
jgi:hypothetical protein